MWCQGFPSGSAVKNLPAMPETQRCKFTPWVSKIPWRRKWQPPPVLLPGKSHRQRSYGTRGCKSQIRLSDSTIRVVPYSLWRQVFTFMLPARSQGPQRRYIFPQVPQVWTWGKKLDPGLSLQCLTLPLQVPHACLLRPLCQGQPAGQERWCTSCQGWVRTQSCGCSAGPSAGKALTPASSL